MTAQCHFYEAARQFIAVCGNRAHGKYEFARGAGAGSLASCRPVGLGMAWLKKHCCTACTGKSEHWRQKQWPSVAERVEVRGIVEDMIANGLDGAFDLLGFELPLQECSCHGKPLETPLAAGRACKLPAASPCAPPV